MTPENFAFWLQGYFELLPNAAVLNADQVKTIREHLELVFEHVTSYGNEPKKYEGPPAGSTQTKLKHNTDNKLADTWFTDGSEPKRYC